MTTDKPFLPQPASIINGWLYFPNTPSLFLSPMEISSITPKFSFIFFFQMGHPTNVHLLLFSVFLINFSFTTTTFACSNGQGKVTTPSYASFCGSLVCFLQFIQLSLILMMFFFSSFFCSSEMNVHLMQTANPGCLVFLVLQHLMAQDVSDQQLPTNSSLW